MSEARHEPVRVPAAVLGELEAVRISGLTNMMDRPRVAEIADAMGFDEAAQWVQKNRGLYGRGDAPVFRLYSPVPQRKASPPPSRVRRSNCGQTGSGLQVAQRD